MKLASPALRPAVIAAAFALTALALGAAAAPANADAATPTTVTTEAALTAALADSTGDAQIALGASFGVAATTVPVKGTHALDLAGHKLTAQNITLNSGADLTVEDSSSPSTGVLAATAPLTGSLAGITTTGATLNILSGTVTATGGGFGAGIGGDDNGAGGTVGITGGTVTATGSGGSAGIGGGFRGAGGTVDIGGGTVTATGGVAAAGIGGGYLGAGGTARIAGGTVTADGGDQGAGIGGGVFGDGGTVGISGGRVTATAGPDGGAGIGGGYHGGGAHVTIGAGAAVTASAADDSNGVIGAGQTGSGFGSLAVDGTLTIPQGNQLVIPSGVTVRGDGLAAGSGAIDNHGSILTAADPIGPGWTVADHSYAVAFDSNYPGGPATTVTHVYAATMAAAGRTLPGVTYPGHTLTGWNTAADGTGTPFALDTALAGDTAVYAQWVRTPAAPQITPGQPPAAMAGTPYSFPVTASGYPAPSFAVTAGTLPDGLELDPASGAITGTPTTAGTWEFTVTASNGVSPAATHAYTLAVTAAPVTPVAPVHPAAPVAPALAATGSNPAPAGLAGLLALASGVGLLLARRRMRPRRR